MCKFCETIYPVEDTSDIAFQRGKYKDFKEDNYIYADKDGTFNIEAQTGDPYESGIVENIKYCPYCGRKLESEDKQCTTENQESE